MSLHRRSCTEQTKSYTFSSDDAKRAAASGLAAATGLRRSTKDFDFDVVAQVHRARCWIGLRLNRAPLAVRAAAAPKVAAAVPWPFEASERQCSGRSVEDLRSQIADGVHADMSSHGRRC